MNNKITDFSNRNSLQKHRTQVSKRKTWSNERKRPISVTQRYSKTVFTEHDDIATQSGRLRPCQVRCVGSSTPLWYKEGRPTNT